MYGEYRFALAPNEQKAFKGFFDQAFVKVGVFYVSFPRSLRSQIPVAR